MSSLNQEQKDLIEFWCSAIEEGMSKTDVQREFFASLCIQFDEKEWLSDKQIACLRRMYERVTR